MVGTRMLEENSSIVGRLGAVAIALITGSVGIPPAHAQHESCKQSQNSPDCVRCRQDPTSGGCELVLPPVCSRDPAQLTAPTWLCEVTASAGPNQRKRVQIKLTAKMADIQVGGYKVKTENYNGSYLSPVVEAEVGDVVGAWLDNKLDPRWPSDVDPKSHAGHAGHGATKEDNPTNLHYFHGGIVTPRNARRSPTAPGHEEALNGTGDNIFVYRKRGAAPFTYDVPIPRRLDARVLEQIGEIPHPSGLNWYHSHLHGYSSDQVMGGLSGLLSIGGVDDERQGLDGAKTNVVACRPDPTPDDPNRCRDDVESTKKLKERTDVRYALLRDISLEGISALPEAQTTTAREATWAPGDKHWRAMDDEWKKANPEANPEQPPAGPGVCPVWRTAGSPEADAKLRQGYCQRAEDKAWLFTINGQRFPTITVEGGRNLLLRLGNLSANVTYWLEIYKQDVENEKLKLALLSIDGVVPAKVVLADANRVPVKARPVDHLVFLPASRAEIYIRNDCRDTTERTYVLRTKGLVAGRNNEASDRWPEIQLARIVLKPSSFSCEEDIALNAVTSRVPMLASAEAKRLPVATKPTGCVDDIDPSKGEHRRVIFRDGGKTSNERTTLWSVLTQIRRPPGGIGPGAPKVRFEEFVFDPDKTVGIPDDSVDLDEGVGKFRPIPFEEYDLGDGEGKVDWNKKHVCVFIDPDHKGSHKQLWVLDNQTAHLHNFHIHQMKFRLATATELTDTFKIKLVDDQGGVLQPAETCPDETCSQPNYQLYAKGATDEMTRWHDTIPMPPGRKVFIIMSFDADEQVGRYVFHCHILKHEDSGLMAPIEVWKSTSAAEGQ